MEDEFGPSAVYPTTIWSEVTRARGGTDAAVAMLGNLLRRYYLPLQTHLRLKFRVSDDQAKDWLQAFVLQKVLLNDLLASADRDKGRFRTFLLNALDNFVSSERRRESAQRRRPSGGLLSSSELTPSDLGELAGSDGDEFAVAWARAIVAETLRRMEAECERKACQGRWRIFKARLLDPLLDGAETPSHDELADRLGFQSSAAASNVLITARRQFDRLLHEVVAEYAGAKAEVELEIRELMRVLSEAK
jgi:hypothetical protein